MIVEGDGITIDVTGSEAEVPTGFNVPFEGSLLVGAYYAVRTLLLDEVTFPEHVPQNDGVFRPVDVIAPKGTIFNPNFPRACFSRFCQVQRVVDNTILALADQLPQQVTAGNSAGIHFCSYSGFHAGDRGVLAVPGGQRGRLRRPLRQGRDGLRRQPHGEHAQQPDRGARPALPRCAATSTSCGQSRQRPGAGAAASASSDATASWSTAPTPARATASGTPRAVIFGGWDGLTASTHKNPGTDSEEYVEAKVTGVPFKAGEYIEFREPNAGGYGDPLDREPALVREDVLDDFTTVELARDAYGVVFRDERALEVDVEATERRRAELRASRDGGSLNALFDRGEGRLLPSVSPVSEAGNSAFGLA